MSSKRNISINEVGLRDGLQSLNTLIPTETKLAMIERLVGLGFKSIEIASFVNPKLVPTMADSEEVARKAVRAPDVHYRGFTPTLKSFELAVDTGIHHVGLAIAASETFNQKNVRCSVEQGLMQAQQISNAAKEKDVQFGACIATAVYCPYEGYISPDKVVKIAEKLLSMGCEAISLGETIGRARPEETYSLLKLLKDYLPLEKIGVHFHDTWGQGIANYAVCLEEGVNSFDTSFGGLGGCPFAPGAAGNVATEDMLYLLQNDKYETGLDLAKVAAVSREFCQENNLPYSSKVGNACLRQQK